MNGTLSSSALGGNSVALVTLQAFARNGSDAYPASGQATATGASGAKVLITVIDGATLRIELDADGDGLYEEGTTRSWSELV